MRVIFICFSIYLALIAYGVTAMANEGGAGDVLVESPVAVEKNVISAPKSVWDVGGVRRDNGFPSSECVMSNQYDNGLELVFKGDGGKLTALRVRDAVNVENTNIRGFIGLGIGKNSYGLQSRSLNNQIDASLLSVGNVADKIIAEGVFRLKISGQDYYFSALNFAEGYARLLTCQGRDGLKTVPVVNNTSVLPPVPVVVGQPRMPSEPIDIVSAQPLNIVKNIDMDGEIEITKPLNAGENVALAMALPMIVPSDYTFKLDAGVDPLVKITWDNRALWQDSLLAAIEPYDYKLFIKDSHIRIAPRGAPRDKGQADIAIKPAEWMASKGDSLSSVLQSWATQHGVTTRIVLDADPVLTSDISWSGDFQASIDRLLAQYTTDATASLNHERPAKQIPAVVIPDATPVSTQYWRALQGTNLRKVLQHWSARENVDFIWDADQTFFVKDSIKSTNDYAQAVSEILNQYTTQSMRPVAQLNKDPDTGRRALVITVKR